MRVADFTGKAIKLAALVLALLALDRLPALTRNVPGSDRLQFILREMHNGQLNADDYHALTGSYYEGLEQVDRVSTDNTENSDYRFRDDFLRFEFKPHLKRYTRAGLRVTNSFGMTSPEYGHEKPPGVRRIAWLGDSIATGAYGSSFERLLEDRLNESDRPPGVQKFELLNFSVPGYVLPQKMFDALEKAPAFHPDVYVVQLDSQEIVGQRKHIARLLQRGVDLKYDFLRDLVKKAGVRPDDDISTVIVRLKPFFVPLTQWFMSQIEKNARDEGARVIIVLVPVVIDPGVTASDFDALHEAVDGMGMPVIDLRDTFRNSNQHELQVIPDSDIHPNVRGHKMIFDDLYAKLRSNPEAWAILTGASPVAAAR